MKPRVFRVLVGFSCGSFLSFLGLFRLWFRVSFWVGIGLGLVACGFAVVFVRVLFLLLLVFFRVLSIRCIRLV